VVEQVVKCFWYGKEEHKKWECMEKKEMRREEVAPRQEIWEKVKKHCGVKGLPLRGVVMDMERWMTKWEVIMFVECRGCDYKGTKIQENRGQGFLGKEQLCNMWCGRCKETWNWKEEEAARGRAERVKCDTCGGKDTVTGGKVERNGKGEVFCLLCKIGKKVPWWNWEGKNGTVSA